MRDYAVFVDSSADMDILFLEKNDIQIVPMRYTLGDKNYEYCKMETEEKLKRFYDAQRKGEFSQTSQVTPQQYINAFSPVMERGLDILYLSLSGGLTNSRDSIHLAEMELTDRYPDIRIVPIDSLSATGGPGLLAELAVYNRKAGMSLQENADMLEEKKHQICHLFLVEDLLYLKHGGRVSAASAIVGTALGVKPILVIDENGALRVVSKQRGKKHAVADLLDRYQRSRNAEDHRISIVHADASDLASELVEKAGRIDPKANITCGFLNPIIGAHTGPGMAAIIYFGDRTETAL